MKKLRAFFKKETVLCLAFPLAVLSCCFVPPDTQYLGYIDFRTLALLFCLMAVVAEIRKAGAFSYLAHVFCGNLGHTRALAAVLVFLCFFSAMFITNDVALLTFVPFTVTVLGLAGQQKLLVRATALEAAAANLGSMLTPVGNPQNIYIQSHYALGTGEFLRVTGPIWLASLALLALFCLSVKKEPVSMDIGARPSVNSKKLLLGLILFAVCLGTVLRLLPWPVMLGAVVLALLILDRSTVKEADWYLLLTFVCFFVFSGNLARIEAVNSFLRENMLGREYFVTLGLSQIISNVPATLLLSGFTENASAVLLGANIGGLGTPVASLATLISLKLYSRVPGASAGRFIAEFTVISLIFLLLLSALALLLG